MLRLADIRVRPKLLFLFMLTGVFPIVVAGYFFGSWKKSLIEESFHKLTAIQDNPQGTDCKIIFPGLPIELQAQQEKLRITNKESEEQ